MRLMVEATVMDVVDKEGMKNHKFNAMLVRNLVITTVIVDIIHRMIEGRRLILLMMRS